MRIYLQGLTMGLAYVAPIGLQNLFVINSALTQRRSRVYLTALIVILWDVSLGVSCFLGAGALMQALPWLQKVILGIGSLIVIWIGIGLLRSRASLEGGRDVNVPLWKLISSAFVVTWINPQALIDGTMMLGAFRASLPEGGDLPFICGFGSASALWFLTLSTVVSLLGSRFNEKILNVFNKVCRGHHLLWLQAAVELCEAHGLALIRREEAMYRGMAASWAATDTAIMAGMLTSYSTPSSQLPKNQNTPKAHSNTP